MKRGRPETRDDRVLMRQAVKRTWQKDIEGLTWREIVTRRGERFTENTRRTLEKERERVAAAIWCKLPPHSSLDELSNLLMRTDVQACLRQEFGLPFRTHFHECHRFVIGLNQLGLKVEARRLDRLVKAPRKKST